MTKKDEPMRDDPPEGDGWRPVKPGFPMPPGEAKLGTRRKID
jgi:hypothetical protein